MIPKTIQPYFKVTQQTDDGDNNIIKGLLTCCGAYDFEIFTVVKTKHRLFSKMPLYPEDDKIVFEVRCKKCGKVISVFNSCFDGYEQCGKKQKNICLSTRLIDCVKCRGESFSVTVKYEYPNTQELQELEISDIDNAFTWICITLKCNKCGAKYRNFVDCETA